MRSNAELDADDLRGAGSSSTFGEPALDGDAWARLAQAGDLDYDEAWLAIQASFMPRALSGITVKIISETLAVSAVWPNGLDPAALMTVAGRAYAEKRGVAQHLVAPQGRAPASIAFPVLVGDNVCAIVAFALDPLSGRELQSAMRTLQWGATGLHDRLVTQRAAALGQAEVRAQNALKTLAVGLDEERFLPACRAVVTDLALRFGCDRVSVGFRRRGRIVVDAISQSAKFGTEMNLVRIVGEAMDEAVDQQAILAHPPPGREPNVTRAHLQLVRTTGAASALTIPLFLRDRFVGAFTFEWSEWQEFLPQEVANLDAVASAAGPILDARRQNDRWLVTKAGESVWLQLKRLLGPGHLARKLAFVLVLALFAVGYYARGSYRISADAEVEGEIQRTLSAALNSYVAEAPVRAGDTVSQGQVMALLDNRDLVLERLKWATEKQRKEFEYEKALGERNRADQNVASTQIEEADAQIKLVDEQLSHARITAPFDGVVISGDLSQSIGANVQRGQVLFEVAPLDRYRVALEVDESQIGDVRTGQKGQLVVASLTSERFPIHVAKITPVSKAHDGRNTFRVEATLDENAPQIRPGMRGAAKIDVDERRLAWIWSRTLVDWLTLQSWRWFG